MGNSYCESFFNILANYEMYREAGGVYAAEKVV
jgi:hypothetical protein